MRVLLLDKGSAGQEASSAAAGMLAAHDAANPPELTALAELSTALYPEFLLRLRELSGLNVPAETAWTLEAAKGETTDLVPEGMSTAGFRRIRENSLDPRKLIAAAVAAVRSSRVVLQQQTAVEASETRPGGVTLTLQNGTAVACGQYVDCTGAWSGPYVRPAKGQMLRVHAPGALRAGTLGNVVVRGETVYLVPRLDGSVVIGATVEDAGFDKTLHSVDMGGLRQRAATLIPALRDAPDLEQWAGLRPGTPDHLPLIGAWPMSEANDPPRRLIAAGHFRNGILLAPATARVVAEMLLEERVSVDLRQFAPGRFREASA